MPFRLNRRQVISGMAALGALAGAPARNAFAQKRVVIPEGDFTPLPIAIPNFVAGTPADGERGAGVAQVSTKHLKAGGLFAPNRPGAFLQRISDLHTPPPISHWETKNAQARGSRPLARQGGGP